MDFNAQIVEAFRTNQGVVTEPLNFGHHLVLVQVPKKDGAERAELWAEFVDTMLGFADYEESAGDRLIRFSV